MSIQDFFYKYYVEPIKLGYGYNIVNTATYALLTVILLYSLYKFFEKFKIKVDKRTVLAISPYIIFGIILRVFEDAHILQSYLFVTPNLPILFFFIISGVLAISIFIERKFKIPYYKIMFVSGAVLVSLVIGFIQIKNFMAILYVLLFYTPIVAILYFVKWSPENKLVLAVQTLDSVVTSVALTYFGYFEQHVLPRFLIQSAGNAFIFVPAKIIVVTLVLIALDKYSEDKEFNRYVKLMIGIIGFIPGARDFLRLVWMT